MPPHAASLSKPCLWGEEEMWGCRSWKTSWVPCLVPGVVLVLEGNMALQKKRIINTKKKKLKVLWKPCFEENTKSLCCVNAITKKSVHRACVN